MLDSTTEETIAEDTVNMPRFEDPPKDENHVLYTAFYLLGVGLLLPWNAFITAIDYFEMMYPGQHADRVFSLCYMLPNMLTLALMLRVDSSAIVSPSSLIYFGYSLFLLALISVPAMDVADIWGGGVVPPGAGFSVVCIAVVVLGVSDAQVQGNLFAITAKMPQTYTQALLAGTAFSGLITSLLRILTKIVVPDTSEGMRISAHVYFSVAALCVAACLIILRRVLSHDVYLYHAQETTRRPTQGGVVSKADDKIGLLVEMVDVANLSEHRNRDNNNHAHHHHHHDNQQRNDYHSNNGYHESEDYESAGVLSQMDTTSCPVASHFAKGGSLFRVGSRQKDVILVISSIWPNAISVAGVYIVTLAIFPGFLAEDVTSEALGDWYPILLITAFNLSDLIGKMAPVSWWLNILGPYQSAQTRLLLIATSARLGFVPLFALCTMGPQVFRSEVVVTFLTLMLGLTSGALATGAMVTAPSRVVDPRLEHLAGNTMVFFLVSGLAIGALCGWLWLL